MKRLPRLAHEPEIDFHHHETVAPSCGEERLVRIADVGASDDQRSGNNEDVSGRVHEGPSAHGLRRNTHRPNVSQAPVGVFWRIRIAHSFCPCQENRVRNGPTDRARHGPVAGETVEQRILKRLRGAIRLPRQWGRQHEQQQR